MNVFNHDSCANIVVFLLYIFPGDRNYVKYKNKKTKKNKLVNEGIESPLEEKIFFTYVWQNNQSWTIINMPYNWSFLRITFLEFTYNLAYHLKIIIIKICGLLISAQK